jgi:hypothetical protein
MRFFVPASPSRVAQKNGEKKLRAHVTRTPEWASSAAREAAVRAAPPRHAHITASPVLTTTQTLFPQARALRPQAPRLADALLARQCALLNKGDLLLLCAHWRYRGDVWRERGNRPSRPPPPQRPQLAPSPPLPLCAAAPPAPGAPLCASDVWAHIGTTLRPLSCRSVSLLIGSAARARAHADADAAALFAHGGAALAAQEAFMANTWLPALGGLTAAARAFECDLPLSAATSRASSFAFFPPAVAEVPALLAFGAAYFRAALRANAARRAAPDITHSPDGALFLDEMRGALELECAMADGMASLADRAKATCSAETYAKAACMLLEALASHCLAANAALGARRRWVEALEASHGDGDGDAKRRKQPPRRPLLELQCPYSSKSDAGAGDAKEDAGGGGGINCSGVAPPPELAALLRAPLMSVGVGA